MISFPDVQYSALRHCKQSPNANTIKGLNSKAFLRLFRSAEHVRFFLWFFYSCLISDGARLTAPPHAFFRRIRFGGRVCLQGRRGGGGGVTIIPIQSADKMIARLTDNAKRLVKREEKKKVWIVDTRGQFRPVNIHSIVD